MERDIMKNTDRSFVRRTALLLALSLLFSLAACGKAPAQDGAQGSGAPAEAVSDASGPDTPDAGIGRYFPGVAVFGGP